MATTEVGIGSVEIDSADVVRLVLQFLREQGLARSAAELEMESGVRVNALTNRDALVKDVRDGKWAQALPKLASVELPGGAAHDVYEHVCLELCEAHEADAARAMLDAPPLNTLRTEDPERKAALERGVARAARAARLGAYDGERAEWWPGTSKDERRGAVAASLEAALGEVAPARLTTLLGQALRWRAMNGDLRQRGRVDVFRGAVKAPAEPEKPPRRSAGGVRLGEGSRPLAACFSPDGLALITGSSDGFVEVWDPATCRLRTDLPYQRDDELLMHDSPVLALLCSPDGTALASGDRDGCLKVWRLSTGACARKFAKAQGGAVTCVAWSRDGTSLATGGADGSVRTHGLRSGRQLQQLRGHQGGVASVAFCRAASFGAQGAEDHVLSAGSDGAVVLWDVRAAEALRTVRAPDIIAKADRTSALGDKTARAVVALLRVPGSESRCVIVERSPTAVLVDVASGNLIQRFSSAAEPLKAPPEMGSRKPGCCFVAAALSRQGGFLYCAGEDRFLYTFGVGSGTLERVLCLDEANDVAGLTVHPHRNLLGSFGDSDQLKLWK